jgi:hypothetical protein
LKVKDGENLATIRAEQGKAAGVIFNVDSKGNGEMEDDGEIDKMEDDEESDDRPTLEVTHSCCSSLAGRDR